MNIQKNLLAFCFILIGSYVNGQHKISHTITLEDIEKYGTGKRFSYPVNINRKTINDTLLIAFPNSKRISQIYLQADTSYNNQIESDAEKPVFIKQREKKQRKKSQEIDMTGLPDGRYKAHLHFPDSGKTIGINIYTRDSDCMPPIDTIDGGPVLLVTERMPEFKGGQSNLMSYLSKNIKLPLAVDYTDYIQGRVSITFVIDEKGKVRNPCVMRPLYQDRLTLLEEEILRVVCNMPDWDAGMSGDKKVATRYFLPIHIHLRSDR